MPDPTEVAAIVRAAAADEGKHYPTRLGIFCDRCGTEWEGDFIVHSSMTRDERHAVIRAHVAAHQGWHCDLATGDLCPMCNPNYPHQPDHIDPDSNDLPEPGNAATRVLAYVAAFGDGLCDVVDNQPLYGRDLQVVANAASAATGRRAGRACSAGAGLAGQLREHLDRQEECGWHHGWPEALAALRAVLDLHQPERRRADEPALVCAQCVDAMEEPVSYPCLTVRSVAEALGDLT